MKTEEKDTKKTEFFFTPRFVQVMNDALNIAIQRRRKLFWNRACFTCYSTKRKVFGGKSSFCTGS